MDSREFGLVAIQQLLKIQDIHYGFWEKGEIPSIGRFQDAQNKYTEYLIRIIEDTVEKSKQAKMLDIGCGIGMTTQKLLAAGYRVDGLVPSLWMAQKATENVKTYQNGTRAAIFDCKIEDFPVHQVTEPYELAFFSESFQYVKLNATFDVLTRILSDTGKIIIFDVFKKDNVTGKSPLGGGHSLEKFQRAVDQYNFTIHTDRDMTDHMSPNLTLINELLSDRLIPFAGTLDAFLADRYHLFYRLFKIVFRRKIAKLSFKYSLRRNEESFKKFKSYRLFILQRG